jgi:protein-disulfide isomerase
MEKKRQRSYILMSFGFVGLLLSLLTGFQEIFPFLQFLCTTACRQTVEINLFWLPVWLWGALFYIVVILLGLFRKDWVLWVVAPAAGIEVALVWVLFLMKAPCVFCIANAAIVIALLILSFNKPLFWQEATLLLVFLMIFKTWIPFENWGSSKRQQGIAAKVGDEVITDQRVEVSLGSKLLELQRDIYRLKKEKLDQIIVDTILQKEAKKKDLPLDKLIEEVVPPNSQPPVTEDDIQKYLDENQERIRDWKGSMAELRERVKSFLEQQQRLRQISSYAHSLEQQYGVQVLLKVPLPHNVKVNVEGAPSEGPEDAPVTIVEFSDYQCPACRSTHAVVKELKALYGKQVRWIFKDYPLKIHREAFKAAEAAHCAGDQNKFWEYQEQAFTTPRLYVGNLVETAGQLGLDKEKFVQCLDGGKYKDYLEKSIQDAVQAGIDRTPSFIINGTVLAGGHTLENLKAAIDGELKKAPEKK